jgi:hypothetical protein
MQKMKKTQYAYRKWYPLSNKDGKVSGVVFDYEYEYTQKLSLFKRSKNSNNGSRNHAAFLAVS